MLFSREETPMEKEVTGGSLAARPPATLGFDQGLY